MPPPLRLGLSTLPLAALGCLVLAFVDHQENEHVVLGYLFGTIFAHATLAAAWTALGPLPLIGRLPLSLVWLALLGLAFAANVGMHGGPDKGVVLLVWACLLGQWLCVQIPLWGLTIAYGSRLRHLHDESQAASPRERQFGIRELMIFTAIVGVVFGIGRVVVGNYASHIAWMLGSEAPIFIFLAVAAIVVTLPLLLATLLPRFAVPAVLATLFLIGSATLWELPLLHLFHQAPGPDVYHLVLINAFTAGWILLLGVAVRLNGYRLAVPKL